MRSSLALSVLAASSFACASLACALPARARAQLHAQARVARPITATNAEDPTSAGTSVETEGRSAARESVSDVLLEVPGARPIRSGWLASFTSASLRGAEGEHTVVLLGDIPLSSADASMFDLSSVPLELLERVVVYRGGAPAWLGQGAIGGVIQLQPARARRTALAATATAGSFDTYGASLRAQVARGAREPSLLGAAGVLGSSGDFQYAYDGKTSFDSSDDRVMRRQNADFVDGHALMRLEQPLGPGALELLLLGFSRVGGEPGAPKDPVLRAERGFTRGVVGLGYSYERLARGERALRLQGIGAVHFTRSQLTDLYEEIGSGSNARDDRSLSASARLAASAAVLPMLELTAVANATRDNHSPEDALERTPLPDSSRTTLAGALEAHLHGRVLGLPAALRGSLRAESIAAELHRERFNTVRASEATELLATYRAAGALELLPGLALSASIASGARAPSMLELFGDGTFILGNIGLAPEESVSIDAGLVHNAQLGELCSSLEARAFDLRIDEQIVYQRNAYAQLQPFNLAESHVRGIELGARAAYTRHVWLTASATFLDTEGKPGKSLPNRPRAVVLVQPALHSGPLSVLDDLSAFFEVAYTASSFDDLDNATLPKRPMTLASTGVASLFWSERGALRITLSDVFDRGGQDLRGFPLPGRSLMASLTYQEDLQ